VVDTNFGLGIGQGRAAEDGTEEWLYWYSLEEQVSLTG